MTARTTNPLLLSHRAPVIHTPPLFYLTIEGFLPEDIYQEALDAFPGSEWFGEQIEGDKRRFSAGQMPELVETLMERYPIWRTIIDWLQDDGFLDDLYNVVRESLLEYRGRLDARR